MADTMQTKHYLGHFYCSFRERETFDVANFQRSIIAQLCHKRDMFSELKNLYEKCQPYLPSSDQLSSVFHSIIESLTNPAKAPGNLSSSSSEETVTLFLDGLDEVPPGSLRDEFLNELEKIASVKQRNLRIVVVSREEADIKSSLSVKDGWTWLTRHAEQVTRDIEEFVETRILKHRRLRSQSNEIKTRLRSRLSVRAQGM